jgi:hypothetical protein
MTMLADRHPDLQSQIVHPPPRLLIALYYDNFALGLPLLFAHADLEILHLRTISAVQSLLHRWTRL